MRRMPKAYFHSNKNLGLNDFYLMSTYPFRLTDKTFKEGEEDGRSILLEGNPIIVSVIFYLLSMKVNISDEYSPYSFLAN